MADPGRGEFLLFKDVSRANLDEMATAKSEKHAKAILQEVMQIEGDDGFPIECQADLYFYAWRWAQEQRFSHEKTSTFLSIMRQVYTKAITDRYSVHESFDHFKWLLQMHWCQRPPFSIGVFSQEDVSNITKYFVDNFYRQYKLYQYLYVNNREVTIKLVTDELYVPMPKAEPLTSADELDPETIPELEHLFRPPTQERTFGEGPAFQLQMTEDRVARVRAAVERQVKELHEEFEDKFKAQDTEFQEKMAA